MDFVSGFSPSQRDFQKSRFMALSPHSPDWIVSGLLMLTIMPAMKIYSKLKRGNDFELQSCVL